MIPARVPLVGGVHEAAGHFTAVLFFRRNAHLRAGEVWPVRWVSLSSLDRPWTPHRPGSLNARGLPYDRSDLKRP